MRVASKGGLEGSLEGSHQAFISFFISFFVKDSNATALALRKGVFAASRRGDREGGYDMAYTDHVSVAARTLAQTNEIVRVPPWAVTMLAGFVGRIDGVETKQAERDIRERCRDISGSRIGRTS